MKSSQSKTLAIFLLPAIILTGCSFWNNQSQDSTPPNYTQTISISEAIASQTQILTTTQIKTQSQQSDAKATILSPDLSKKIQSPLKIKGKIDSSYFFLFVFPITLKDANGKILSTTVTHAESEWTQPGLIPFSTIIIFKTPETPQGKLILSKDNPSGLPENDATIEFEVSF